MSFSEEISSSYK